MNIVAVTEIWLKHDEMQSNLADILPPGYSFFHEPRADQRTGGRVGIPANCSALVSSTRQ